MPGADAPAASCAMKKAHELVTTGSPENTGIPCASGFNGLLRALPGEPGFLATIISAMRQHRRRLDASVGASGPHGLAVRFVSRTPCEETSGHRVLPRVRGDREPPLS